MSRCVRCPECERELEVLMSCPHCIIERERERNSKFAANARHADILKWLLHQIADNKALVVSDGLGKLCYQGYKGEHRTDWDVIHGYATPGQLISALGELMDGEVR